MAGSVAQPSEPSPGVGVRLLLLQKRSSATSILATVGFRDEAYERQYSWTTFGSPGPPDVDRGASEYRPPYSRATFYEVALGTRMESQLTGAFSLTDLTLGLAGVDAAEPDIDVFAALATGVGWQVGPQVRACIGMEGRRYFSAQHLVVSVVAKIECEMTSAER